MVVVVQVDGGLRNGGGYGIHGAVSIRRNMHHHSFLLKKSNMLQQQHFHVEEFYQTLGGHENLFIYEKKSRSLHYDSINIINKEKKCEQIYYIPAAAAVLKNDMVEEQIKRIPLKDTVLTLIFFHRTQNLLGSGIFLLFDYVFFIQLIFF